MFPAIDLNIAKDSNESGISIHFGCYVAIHKATRSIVAVSEMPDATLDSCHADLLQFCEEMETDPIEYEFAIVV